MLYLCDTAIHTSSFKIPKESNKMDNKSDEQFIITQATIEANNQEMKAKNQDYDEKMMNTTEDFKKCLHQPSHK